MKKRTRLSGARLLTAALCLLILLATAGVSLAAYTHANFSRAVLQNKNSALLRFSSNYLYETAGGGTFARQVVPITRTEGQGEYCIDIRIYNFLKSGESDLVSASEIPYTLTVELESTRDGGTYRVERVEDGTLTALTAEGGVYTHRATLPAGTATTHTYRVTFAEGDIDKLQIRAKAVPDAAAGGSGQFLAAVIAPCTAGRETLGFHCEGSFPDSGSGDMGEHAGVNFSVIASGGAGRAKVSWDTALVRIDPFFLEKLTDAEKHESEGYVIFPMSQEDGTGSYLIPFYWVDAGMSGKKWSGAGEIIRVEAVK